MVYDTIKNKEMNSEEQIIQFILQDCQDQGIKSTFKVIRDYIETIKTASIKGDQSRYNCQDKVIQNYNNRDKQQRIDNHILTPTIESRADKK